MDSPRGHLRDLSWTGENDAGLKSGSMTVTLPLNLPTRMAAFVPTNLEPPRPALVTHARPCPSIWTANGWLRPPPVIVTTFEGSPPGYTRTLPCPGSLSG